MKIFLKENLKFMNLCRLFNQAQDQIESFSNIVKLNLENTNNWGRLNGELRWVESSSL